MKPLEGLRILTVENFGAGPYGTMFLAGLGAEVIKVENPATGGDASRHLGPHMLGEDDSEYFQTFNLWKKSISLDLNKDLEKFHALVAKADAMVNNLRGDVPAKLGLDYKSLSSINEKIVCLHISAYGRDNERASWPGYDFLMQAEAGLMDLTGEPEGAPSRFGTSIIDCMSGMTGAAALLACVLRARRTGKGCDVDASLFDVALHQLTYMGTWYLNGGEPSSRQPRSAHYSLTPVQTFPTADGWIFVMCMKDGFWSSLCEKPGPHQQPVMEFLERCFRSKSLKESLAFLSTLDVCYAPVNTLPEALEAAAGKLLKDELGRRHLAPPIRFRDEPARPGLREPRLGEHDSLKKH